MFISEKELNGIKKALGLEFSGYEGDYCTSKLVQKVDGLNSKLLALEAKLNHWENKEQAEALIKEAHEFQSEYTFEYVNGNIQSTQTKEELTYTNSGGIYPSYVPVEVRLSLKYFECEFLCKYRKVALDKLKGKKK